MRIVINEKQLRQIIESNVESSLEETLSQEEINDRLEKIKKLAAGFSSNVQFRTQYPKEWAFLRKRNLMDRVFSNIRKNKPQGFYTPEMVSDIAKKYSSRFEFQINEPTAYQKALKYKLDMSSIFGEPRSTGRSKMTLDQAIEIAQNFKGTKKEFYQKQMTAYKLLQSNNLVDNYFGNKESKKEKLVKIYKFNTFQECIDFVNMVSEIANEQNHHPDLEITSNKVKLTITDHEKGHVSEKCYRLINAIDDRYKSKETINNMNLQEQISRIKEIMTEQGIFKRRAQQQTQGDERSYTSLKTKWSQVNNDTSKMSAFGEGMSQDQNISRQKAHSQAMSVLLGKTGKDEATFSTNVDDEATFQKSDGTYITLILISVR